MLMTEKIKIFAISIRVDESEGLWTGKSSRTQCRLILQKAYIAIYVYNL